MMTAKKKSGQHAPTATQQRDMLCDKLGFAASESYKLLRTNLLFALPDEKKCRVVGITSALQSEGKTTTAINLAYTIAETGKRVLLIEGDMRLPTVATKLKIHGMPGLSDVLSGQSRLEEAVQPSGVADNFIILCAGSIPPNPAELLCSEYMERTLEILQQQFDFLIIDLPPVNAVADGLAISKLVQGMILAVRQDYDDSRELDAALRRLEYLETKVLGFVMTYGSTETKKYRNRKKNRGYGYGYGYGYGHHSHSKAQNNNLADRKADSSKTKK